MGYFILEYLLPGLENVLYWPFLVQLTPFIVTLIIITFYYIVTPVKYSKNFIIKIYPM
jgi:hypothetical protein